MQKHFGNNDLVTVMVRENEYIYGEMTSDVRISWASTLPVDLKGAQEFTNAMIEAQTFAAAEMKRLGLTIEKGVAANPGIVNIENMAKVWLNDMAYLENDGNVNLMTDACLTHFDHCYSCGEFEYLDKILEIVEPEKHSLNVIIGILTWSKWRKDKLPHRAVYAKRVVQYLHDSGQYEEGLVSGLID